MIKNISLEEPNVESLENLKTDLSIIGKITERVISITQKIFYLFPEIILVLLSANIISELKLLEDGNTLSPTLLMNLVGENLDSLILLFVIYISIFVIRIVKNIFSRFFKKIASRFEDRFDILADEIVNISEEFFKAFWWDILRKPVKQYYDFVANENKYFELPGTASSAVPCSLKDTCVNLNVSLSVENKNGKRRASNNPINLNDNPDIWHFLALGRRNDKFRRIVILGKPGAGKSTLLKRIAVAYAQKEYKKISQVSRKAPDLIPVLLSVREISDEILSNDKKDIYEIIVSVLDGLEIAKSERFKKWLKKCLNRGKCLIMVDGLDEVADNKSRQLINFWVNNLIKNYPRNFFLITSRYFGHDESILKNVVILEVRDLNLVSAEEFIVRWYLNRELIAHKVDALRSNGNLFWEGFPKVKYAADGCYAAAKKKANALAGSLISRIRSNSSLARMAVNPLSLSMMVIVHSNGNQLPESRAELYRVICDSLLSPRRDLDPFDQSEQVQEIDLNKAQKIAVLQSLSLDLMKTNRIEFSSNEISDMLSRKILELTGNKTIEPERFLEYIKKSSGLLIDTSIGKHQFSHRCIQEYLAASQVRESKEENLLVRQVNNNWWNETIRIYASTSIIDSAINIVRIAVDRFIKNPEKNAVAFKLAYDCLEECPRLPEGLKAKLYNLLDKNLESENPALRKYSAEVKLLQRFSRNFMGFNQNLEFDREYLSQSEYQLFIDSMLSLNKYYQPDSWYSSSFPKGTSLESVTVLRPADAEIFCDWLSKMHAEKGFKFRLPSFDEENLIYSQNLVKRNCYGCWCKNGKDYFIVGADSKWINIVKESLHKVIRSDLYNARMLRGKFQRAHSIAIDLMEAASSNKKENFSKSLESVLKIDVDLDGYRGVSINTKLIFFLIHSIRQTKNILNSVKVFRRDGNPRTSKQTREYLEDLRDHLKSNRDLCEMFETQHAEFLIQDALNHRGHKYFREQELDNFYELFQKLSDALADSLKRVCLDLNFQIQAINSALKEVDFYDGSHDINLVIEVFNEFLSGFKLDDKEKTIVLAGVSIEYNDLLPLKDVNLIRQYVRIFKAFLNRSSSKRKEIDLACILPFFSLAFSVWSMVDKVLCLNVRRFKDNSDISNCLVELEMKKKRIIRAYVVVVHASLGLQGKLPLLGSIRVVREKVLPGAQAVSIYEGRKKGYPRALATSTTVNMRR
ncbi:MAG: NACHT domain-containing protein [Leptolyngbya sp. SIO1D8]|nr:NACHT domain-containing protein [Leptolyngbya sp. SIO1D8]